MTKSKEEQVMATVVNITGQRFGRLIDCEEVAA
jgi:hypothetical protein